MSIIQKSNIADLETRSPLQAEDTFMVLTPEGDLERVTYNAFASRISGSIGISGDEGLAQRVLDIEAGDVPAINSNIQNAYDNAESVRVALQNLAFEQLQRENALRDSIYDNNGLITDAGTALDVARDRIDLAEERLITAQNRLNNADGRLNVADLRLDGAEARLGHTETDLITAQNKLNGIDTDIINQATLISQNEAQILLKASQEELDGINQRVTDSETTLSIQATEIAARVKQSVYDVLEGTVTDNSAAIIENADQIALKVGQSVYDTLEGRVTDSEASIVINANQIQQKVSQSVYNTLAGRVTDAESSITENADQIALRVKQSVYDLLTGRVTDAESSIVENANQIALKVSQSVYDTLAGTVVDNTSSITENADAIALKVSQSIYDVLEQTVQDNTANITINTDSITEKVSQSVYDILDQTVTDNSATIQANIDAIALKVEQSVFDTANQQIQANLAQITVNTDSITSKVSQSVFNDLGDRVTTAESTIVQQAGLIQQRVTQTDYDQGIDDTRVYASSQADDAQQAAQSYADTKLNDYVEAVVYNSDISDLQNQIDGQIDSYFKSYDPLTTNEPASEWTTETIKARHANDTFTNIDTGASWHWVNDAGVWKWAVISDTATQQALALAAQAQDTADGKRRIFTQEPVPPYDAGDLWTQGNNGDILVADVSKTEGQAYALSDWVESSKYTDDSRAILAETQAKGYADDLFIPLETRVTNTESSITQNADQIALRVTQTIYQQGISDTEGYADTAASSAQVAAQDYADIQSNAAQSAAEDYALAKANLAETQAKSYSDGIVTVAEQNAIDQAEVLANQAEADAKGYSDNIFGPLDTRVTSAESDIVQNSNQIALRVTETIYTQGISDTEAYANQQAITAENNAKNYTDAGVYHYPTNSYIETDDASAYILKPSVGIMEGTSAVSGQWPGSPNGTLTIFWSGSNRARQIWQSNGGVSYEREVHPSTYPVWGSWREVEDTIGAQAKATLAQANAEGYADGIFGPLEGRVTISESDITQNANQIALKVNQTEYDGLVGRVTTAESELVQQANSISAKVEQTEFDSLFDDVSSHSTLIAGLQTSVGDIETNVSGIDSNLTAVEQDVGAIGARTVLFTNVSGNIASLDLLSGVEGSVVQIKGDQVNITGATTFASGYDPSTKETPLGAQIKADSAENIAKGYADTQITAFGNTLGDVAYSDLVEKAKLGNTIIDGGYFRTVLFEANSIKADKIDLQDLYGVSASLTGSLTVGDNGNVLIDGTPQASLPTADTIANSQKNYGSHDLVINDNYQVAFSSYGNSYTAINEGVIRFDIDTETTGTTTDAQVTYWMQINVDKGSGYNFAESGYYTTNKVIGGGTINKSINVKTFVNVGDDIYVTVSLLTPIQEDITDVSISVNSTEYDPKVTITEKGVFYSNTTGELSRLGQGGDGASVVSATAGWNSISNKPLDSLSSDFVVNAGVASLNPAADVTFANATFTGDVTVQGQTFKIDNELRAADSIITVNDGEVGAGTTPRYTGMEIDRGTENPFFLGFDETLDRFVIGQDGQYQVAATRENNPLNDGLAYFDAATNMMKTISSKDNISNWNTAYSNRITGTNFTDGVLSIQRSGLADFTENLDSRYYKAGDNVEFESLKTVHSGTGRFLQLKHLGSSAIINNSVSVTTRFQVAGQTVMSLGNDPAPRMGVNINNPSYTLHVNGSFNVSGLALVAGNTIWHAGNLPNPIQTGDNASFSRVIIDSSADSNLQFNQNGSLQFLQRWDSSDSVFRAYIYEDGNYIDKIYDIRQSDGRFIFNNTPYMNSNEIWHQGNLTGNAQLLNTAGYYKSGDNATLNILDISNKIDMNQNIIDNVFDIRSSLNGRVLLRLAGPSGYGGIYDDENARYALRYDNGSNLTINPIGAIYLDKPTYVSRLIIPSTGDASVQSENHGFQIGATTSTNIIMDNNEIMARNNGLAAFLNLNPDGGLVRVNPSQTNRILLGDGLVDSPKVRTGTLLADLFKPTIYRGMGGKFVFSPSGKVTEVVSVLTSPQRLHFKVENNTFSYGDHIVFSQEDASGFHNVVGEYTTDSGSNLVCEIVSGDFNDVREGDNVMRVNKNLIYANGLESTLAGFTDINGFADSPFGNGTKDPSWLLKPEGIEVNNGTFRGRVEMESGLINGTLKMVPNGTNTPQIQVGDLENGNAFSLGDFSLAGGSNGSYSFTTMAASISTEDYGTYTDTESTEVTVSINSNYALEVSVNYSAVFDYSGLDGFPEDQVSAQMKLKLEAYDGSAWVGAEDTRNIFSTQSGTISLELSPPDGTTKIRLTKILLVTKTGDTTTTPEATPSVSLTSNTATETVFYSSGNDFIGPDGALWRDPEGVQVKIDNTFDSDSAFNSTKDRIVARNGRMTLLDSNGLPSISLDPRGYVIFHQAQSSHPSAADISYGEAAIYALDAGGGNVNLGWRESNGTTNSTF